MTFGGAPGPCVVIDATEIHRDWYLAGLEFPLLRFLGRSNRIHSVVPASVVAEAVANHERQYSKARRTLMKAAGDLRRVGGGNGFYMPQVPEVVDYAAVLEERFESLRIEVIPPPNTPHHEIVARAVSRRPPFDQSGSGYRDTLVWMTCLDLAEQARDVYLVSQDKDFAGKDSELAPELAEEVLGMRGNVTLVRHLGKWLTEQVPWSDVSDLREASALARDEEVAAIFAPWDMFEDPGLTPSELGLPPSAEILEMAYSGTGGYGFGHLERMSHEKIVGGADRIVYEFPIEFEVGLTMSTEDAQQAGFIQHEGSASGVEDITTNIPMIGLMTVVHDERNVEGPIWFEDFKFGLTSGDLAHNSGDHPDQLRLAFDEGALRREGAKGA